MHSLTFALLHYAATTRGALLGQSGVMAGTALKINEVSNNTNSDSKTLHIGLSPEELVEASQEAVEWHRSDHFAGQPFEPAAIPDEVIVMGDIHGDYTAFFQLARSLAMVDEGGSWIKQKDSTRYFVQLGDVADRGPRSKDVYNLIKKMRGEAELQGDAIFSLLGNHEIFLLCGQLNYFSPEEKYIFYDNSDDAVRRDYSPHGDLGSEIRQNYLPSVRINDTIFVHAGFDDLFRTKDFNRLRRLTLEAIDAKQCDPDAPESSILMDKGIYWTRKVSNVLNSPSSVSSMALKACDYVDTLLQDLGAGRIIVGHTPTLDGEVESWCSGKWVLHDTGMSRWMRGSSRVTILYKSYDKEDNILPLSQWVHVQWQPKFLPESGSLEIIGSFIETGNMTVSDREQFLTEKMADFDWINAIAGNDEKIDNIGDNEASSKAINDEL